MMRWWWRWRLRRAEDERMKLVLLACAINENTTMREARAILLRAVVVVRSIERLKKALGGHCD